MAKQAEDTKDNKDRKPVSNYVEALRRGVPFRDEDGVLHYPTMRSRPQPTFTLDPLHRFLLYSSVVVSIGYTLWMVARIPSMPEQVPMHFSADGSVNRYGSPWEMLFVAFLTLTTIIGCAVLTRYPRIYNYDLGKVTEDNIQAHYKNSVQMMVWMVFSLAVVHVIILGSIAGDWPASPAIWIGLALVLGSAAFFILRMFKL
ncbi:DUF1648 domain-containing protein [Microbacterium amylolyticum]|uniref:DUF1648 domain-containing protein n=1 Tax=Microbacterium amylolyticum TaxID=936337 RepID=A0ABS4ZHB2_9MICO|nr:DUF1648 domain-containing protein [Microbacterium amylolyticum]MBP2436592.1 hypothetical protein [Microbacterium amylolyticum]